MSNTSVGTAFLLRNLHKCLGPETEAQTATPDRFGGYLNEVVSLDPNGQAVTKGQDTLGRIFIRFQVEIEVLDPGINGSKNLMNYRGVFTAFCRHTDDDTIWVVANNTNLDLDDHKLAEGQVSKFFSNSAITAKEALTIVQLVDGGEIEADCYYGKFRAKLIGTLPVLMK